MNRRVNLLTFCVSEDSADDCMPILAAPLPRTFWCVILITAFSWKVLGVPTVALAFQSRSQGQVDSDDICWLIRDDALSGWEHRDNWNCDGKSVVCNRYSDADHARNRIHWKDTLPADFELVFEWQEITPRPTKYACPGFSMNYDSVNGTRIDYQVGNLALRIQAAPPPNGSGIVKVSDSWSTVSNGIKDYSEAVGRWNKAAVRCVGQRIQFAVNNVNVFDINLENERDCRNDGDIRCKQLAIDRWINREKGKVRLSIECYHTDPSYSSLVRLRSLGVRAISAVAEDGRKLSSSGEASHEPIANAGTSEEWRQHDSFAALVLSPDDLVAASVEYVPRCGFMPTAALSNPGMTSDPELIEAYTSEFYTGVVQRSDISCMCIAEFEAGGASATVLERPENVSRSIERCRIWIVSWKLASSESATSLLRHLQNGGADSDVTSTAIQHGQYVTLLRTTSLASKRVVEYFVAHLQRRSGLPRQ